MIHVVTTICRTGGNMCNLLCDWPRNVITSLPCTVSWYRQHSNLHIISIFIPSFCCLYLSWKPAVPFLSIAHLSVLKQVRQKPSSSADPYYHRCREVSRCKGHHLCHLTTCAEHWRRTANILLVQLRERLTHWESLLSFFCCLKKRSQEWRQHIKQGRDLLNSANEVMASVEKLIKWE